MPASLSVLNDATFEGIQEINITICSIEISSYPNRCLAHGHGLFGDRQEQCSGYRFC